MNILLLLALTLGQVKNELPIGITDTDDTVVIDLVKGKMPLIRSDRLFNNSFE